MNMLSEFGLRTKFVVMFLVITSLVVATGAIGFSGVTDVGASADELETEGDTRYAVVLVAAGFEQQHNAIRAQLLDEDGAQAEFDEGVEEVDEGLEVLDSVELNPDEQALFEELQEQENEFEELNEEFNAELEAGNEEEAAETAVEIDELEDEIEDTVDEFAAEAEQDTEEAAAAVEATTQQSMLYISGVSLLSLIVALGMGVVLSRHVGNPLREAAESATKITNGELAANTTETDRSDEVGELQNAFVEMESYLETVAGQASALADQEFDDPVFDEEVPGELGEAFSQMHADLQRFIRELEASKQEARALATSLESQAEIMGETMARTSDGDFTQRLDEDLDNEAMSTIAAEFNAMLDELEGIIVRIRDFAAEVDAASEQVTASAEEVENASQDVSESIQKIAADADEQNQQIQQVTNEMSNLSASIEQVASSTDEVAAIAERAVEIGDEGQQHANQAASEMDAIEAKAEETVSEMESLNSEMNEIGEIVELIDDIAEQTNKLALNASVEAARAGNGSGSEGGDGFGVVADEIKGLAEETSEATQEIDALISDVQEATDRAVEDMREMGTRVTGGRDTVDEAVTALEEIVEQVERANGSIQSINDATDDQAASTEEAVAMTDEVGEISQRTKGETEDVAAAAEEQTSTAEQVSRNIQSLSQQASELREYMSEFDVNSDRSR